MDIHQEVSHLAHARKAETNYRAEITDIEEQLAATPLGQRLASARTVLKKAQLDVEEATTTVRDTALDLFAITGDKLPHPAVTIIMSTILDYDPSEALAYCREHLPKALKLDKSAFEKAVKAIEPDFVRIIQSPATRIAADLSPYLEEGGETQGT